MTIWNLGSINSDLVYSVPHLPGAGETLAAMELQQFLGGKGANMSVAATRAGSQVCHIGAVGSDGRWAIERLTEYGVETSNIAQIETPTGHAVIAVDPDGENQILLFGGSNQHIGEGQLNEALSKASSGDILLIQNETNAQVSAAELARAKGMKVCYAAAPFDADAVQDVLPLLDFLILNEVEASQLTRATGQDIAELPVPEIIVTLGSKGCRHIQAGTVTEFPAFTVEAVDTTGAGDTFAGYVVAGMDQGLESAGSIDIAMRAAAIMVTRMGTADVIPTIQEVRTAAL